MDPIRNRAISWVLSLFTHLTFVVNVRKWIITSLQVMKFRAASLQIQTLDFSSIILQHLPLFSCSNRSQWSPRLMAGWNRRRKGPDHVLVGHRTIWNLLTFSQCYALNPAARSNSTFGREVSQSLSDTSNTAFSHCSEPVLHSHQKQKKWHTL